MSDFSATTRNSAIWSGDSRKVANGKANEVILTKQGKLEIPDLSHIEAVQMGHVMEPVIGRLAQQQLQTELVKIEESLTHAKHPWFKSHFDFCGKKDGKSFLVEAKNYNASVRGKFDVTGICPPADMAQLVHEAAVYGVDMVYLAILFGGQEFLLIPFNITDEQKDDLVKQMAVVWGHAQAGTTLPPEDLEQVKLLYPQEDVGSLKTASASVEQACLALAQVKANIKALESQEEQLQTLVAGYMGDASVLSNIEGQVLATWKNAKPSLKFDSKLFQSAMPDIYGQFVREMTGSRRFLIK
jgi:predicted phage-related endonuclease